ncbi:MAG: HlyD family secretion protein [Anaerolineales bacterium]
MNTKKTLIFLVLSLIAIFALGACGAEETPTPVVEESPGLDYVIAEGHVLPLQSSWLNFAAVGRVAEILVSEGEEVTRGQELIQLADRENAQVALSSAQLELIRAQQDIDAFLRTGDLAAAQSWQDYLGAQTLRAAAERAWERLDIDYLEDRIDDAVIDVHDQEEDLAEAQDEWEKYQDVDPDNYARKAAEDDLEDAQEDYNEALRDLEEAQRKIDGPRADLDAALAAEAEAKRIYEMVSSEGFDLDQKALLEARLETAEIALRAALKALDDYTLVAPFRGTVTDLYLEVGQLVGPEVPALQLADLSQFEIKTSDLTELEVVKIHEGQSVEITPDALPDLMLMGTVDRIGESFTTLTGDIIYTVTITLDESDPQLRWGMTVELRFISE